MFTSGLWNKPTTVKQTSTRWTLWMPSSGYGFSASYPLLLVTEEHISATGNKVGISKLDAWMG